MNLGFAATEMERQASFWTTGGLAAVHSQGRSRDAIFDALERRETYGTSGPRILLWFNTVDGTPMGGTVRTDKGPVFEVKAVGRTNKNGCPEDTLDLLGAERVQKLCANECYNPSDERLRITRIEIVRIRPQITPDEKVDGLIDDPWMVHECPADGEGVRLLFPTRRLQRANAWQPITRARYKSRRNASMPIICDVPMTPKAIA